MDKISGIYKIENLINHKVYVGQSQNIFNRWKSHLNDLNHDKHYNPHLQRAWNKYSENNFKFEIIECCDIDSLDEREIYWIAYFDSFKNGYNQNIGGDGNRGWIISEESKLRMSENHTDVSGVNNPMYGKSLYDVLNEDEVKEWKHKISVANSGENNSFYGKHHTDETKAKISQAKTGKSIKAKKVICLNTKQNFKSATEAENKLHINDNSIRECCKGQRKSAGKHPITGEKLHWMFYDDYIVSQAKAC